ncbi:hypothetical protein [Ruegeria hyattellae]|uniref:hypothetical protein n=1 Tax=Ruegeria hyattellae TaxID=3233337 RepID=UPI00355AFA28
MIKIYARALRTFTANFLLFFGLSVIMALLSQVLDSSSTNGASLFVYAFVALSCHRLLLTGERASEADLFSRRKDGPLAGRQWPFMWRLGMFWLVTACFWGLFLYLIVGLLPETDKTSVTGAAILALVPAALVFYVLAALFGTVLPAAASESDLSLATAFQRGRVSFWVTIWRLLTGNGLFSIVSLVALLSLANIEIANTGPAMDIAVGVLGELFGMFMIMLTAAALCMAYETKAPVAETTEA